MIAIAKVGVKKVTHVLSDSMTLIYQNSERIFFCNEGDDENKFDKPYGMVPYNDSALVGYNTIQYLLFDSAG
jgi:hypothetical protein